MKNMQNYYSEEEKIEKCRELITNSKKMVILTGAGMDTASGIPDFRSQNGVYSKAPESILDINNFYKNPYEVMEFIKKYMLNPEAKPNEGHYMLGKLEGLGKEVIHITQNITKFLEAGGAKKVIHVHGEIEKAKCLSCGKEYNTKDILGHRKYYCDCEDKGLIKPNIIFYGETINNEFDAEMAVRECDLLLIMGTSLTVYPIADLPNKIKIDVPMIIINKDYTMYDNDRMSIVFRSDITETLKKLIL